MVDDIDAPLNDSNTSQDSNQTPEKTPQQIRSEYFVSDLDAKLTAEDVKIAFTIILDPKSSEPIVYARGTTYSLTRLLVDTAKYFKARLSKELEV